MAHGLKEADWEEGVMLEADDEPDFGLDLDATIRFHEELERLLDAARVAPAPAVAVIRNVRTPEPEEPAPADAIVDGDPLVHFDSIDAAGNVVRTARPLSELMREADDEIAAAGEIEACALGTAIEVAA